MINQKRIWVVALVLLALPIAIITLTSANAVEMSNSPESRMIEKCIDKMSSLESAEVSIEGYFEKESKTRIEFNFDGVLQLPGNLDGIMKLKAPKFMIEGRSTSIDGKSWFHNPLEEKWEKSDDNDFNLREENPLYTIPEILWMVSYYPEYLKNGLVTGSDSDAGLNADLIKFDFDLDKIHDEADIGDHPDELVFLSEALSGDKATIQLLIDKKSGYLAGLGVELDEFQGKRTSVKFMIRLKNHNLRVNIEKPVGM